MQLWVKIVKICTFIQLKFAQFSILSALPFTISVSVAERKLVYWILRPRLPASACLTDRKRIN